MKETVKYLKKVYKYGKKYNKSFILFMVGSLVAIFLNVLYPLFCSKQLIYIANSVFEQLLFASLIVLSLSIFSILNSAFIRKNTQKYFRGVTRDIQTNLAKEILKISNKSLDKESSGVFIQRLTSDTDSLGHVFTRCTGYITGMISQIGVLIAVFILDYRIGIYYLITAIISTLIYLYYAKKTVEKDKIYRKQNEKVTGLTSELVRGIRLIKMLNSKDIYIANLSSNIDDASKKLFDFRDMDRKKEIAVCSILSIYNFVLITILILFISKGYILAGTALILYNYHDNIYGNMMYYVDALIFELKSFTLSSKRVFDVLEDKKFEKETFGKKHIDNIIGSFEFKDACFSYDGKKKVLDHLNMKIDENKTYGIVGKSGEGKTTIFNLLCKMYNLNKGKIFIDGINIKELDEESIRGNITIISQNPYIFNLSIKDNLKLVKENVTDKEIKEACKIACLSDFIEKLPQKYNTVVGEGGITLSGGQRQRLAIARALIQKTKIILFDEATSALDNETQEKIQNAINNLKDNYTIVIIAHRLSTIINCDKILFMKDGVIENIGTHKELLKKSKSYKELYNYELEKNN